MRIAIENQEASHKEALAEELASYRQANDALAAKGVAVHVLSPRAQRTDSLLVETPAKNAKGGCESFSNAETVDENMNVNDTDVDEEPTPVLVNVGLQCELCYSRCLRHHPKGQLQHCAAHEMIPKRVPVGVSLFAKAPRDDILSPRAQRTDVLLSQTPKKKKIAIYIDT